MIDETDAQPGDAISVESAAPPAEEAVSKEAGTTSTDSETGSGEDAKLGEPDAANTGEVEKQPKRNRVSYGERIAQLTKQNHVDALEINALRHRVRRLTEEQKEGDAAPEQSERKALKLELAQDAVASAEEVQAVRLGQERQLEWESRVEDAALREKFHKVQGVSPAMCDIIAYSDEAEALTRHFVSNPEDAQRISRLPVGLQARAVIDLANGFSQKPKVRSVSQAPEPGSTLKGGSNPTRKSAGEMPYREYEKMRQKQMEADGR